MRKALVLSLFGALCVAVNVGCNNKESDGPSTRPSTRPVMASDGCPHCEGVQILKADGTCPQCGMAMRRQ